MRLSFAHKGKRTALLALPDVSSKDWAFKKYGKNCGVVFRCDFFDYG
jgi:hypothetical protein